jgi:GH25 family lysozyme M1 (1,4-beta-N-acetylmuramidase)
MIAYKTLKKKRKKQERDFERKSLNRKNPVPTGLNRFGHWAQRAQNQKRQTLSRIPSSPTAAKLRYIFEIAGLACHHL